MQKETPGVERRSEGMSERRREPTVSCLEATSDLAISKTLLCFRSLSGIGATERGVVELLEDEVVFWQLSKYSVH